MSGRGMGWAMSTEQPAAPPPPPVVQPVTPKGCALISVLAMALIIATAKVVFKGHDSSPPRAASSAKPRLLNYEVSKDRDGVFVAIITGTITNESRTVYRSVKVEFNLYQGETLVGNASDVVSNLEPGRDWYFKARPFEHGYTAKLAGITAF
jgi:hypothetical protein